MKAVAVAVAVQVCGKLPEQRACVRTYKRTEQKSAKVCTKQRKSK